MICGLIATSVAADRVAVAVSAVTNVALAATCGAAVVTWGSQRPWTRMRGAWTSQACASP